MQAFMGRGDAYQVQGLDGWDCIDDTATHTGTWRGILVVNDAVINALIVSDTATFGNDAGLEGITLPAGLFIGGNFTSIDLTSGVVLAFKR